MNGNRTWRSALTGVIASVALAALPVIAQPAAAASAAGPALREPAARMADALRCHAPARRADHEPVLLVHGATATAAEEWEWSWQPALLAAGFDVCTVDLPERAMTDAQRSAEYVVAAIRAMDRRFDSSIDVVATSLGPAVVRWAVKWWPDVRATVDDLVSLAGLNQGSDISKITCASGSCPPVLWQFARDSKFVEALNAGDQTPGGIDHTSIYTRNDIVVFPQFPTSVSEIDGAVNVPLETLCPGRAPDHIAILADSAAYAAGVDALTHEGPFDPGRFDVGVCATVLLPGVTPTEALGREYLIAQNGLLMFGGVTTATVDAEPPLRGYAQP